MATKNKTAYTTAVVADFIHSFVDTQQKMDDSFRLIELMEKWSGFKAVMYGPTIIGFGNYHYKYSSGHEGDAPIIGFSPRKAAFSLYVYTPQSNSDKLLQKLGKFRMGKSCIYFKRLEELDINILEKLCKATIKYMSDKNERGDLHVC